MEKRQEKNYNKNENESPVHFSLPEKLRDEHWKGENKLNKTERLVRLQIITQET